MPWLKGSQQEFDNCSTAAQQCSWQLKLSTHLQVRAWLPGTTEHAHHSQDLVLQPRNVSLNDFSEMRACRHHLDQPLIIATRITKSSNAHLASRLSRCLSL